MPSADFLRDKLTAWDSDHPETMAHGLAALAGIRTADDYTAAVDRLASCQVGAIATARMETALRRQHAELSDVRR